MVPTDAITGPQRQYCWPPNAIFGGPQTSKYSLVEAAAASAALARLGTTVVREDGGGGPWTWARSLCGWITSVKDLNAKIRQFITGWNDRKHPFVWTKAPEEILAKANPKPTSETRH